MIQFLRAGRFDGFVVTLSILMPVFRRLNLTPFAGSGFLSADSRSSFYTSVYRNYGEMFPEQSGKSSHFDTNLHLVTIHSPAEN